MAKPQPLGADDIAFIGAPDVSIYQPRQLVILGHAIWVGVSASFLPPLDMLWDLLVSDRVKQCTHG